jgi:hypothetical protein
VAAAGIQLVIGWVTEADGSVWPALGSAAAFKGSVVYAATREEAAATAQLVGTGIATAMRDAGLFAFVS